MTTTTETQTRINYDLTPETHGSCSGTHVHLYLIPAEETNDETPKVITWSNVGAGCPEPAWHSRWLSLPSPSLDYCADSLLEILELQEDELVALAECYEGSHWDGNNHVGSWSEDCDAIEIDVECETYCDASDWLGGNSGREIVDIVSESGSIISASETIVSEAVGIVRLDQDEVESALEQRLSDELETLDPDDEDDTDQIVLLCRLLDRDCPIPVCPPDLHWQQLPEDGGQAVDVHYAINPETPEWLYQRINDRSEPSVSYWRWDIDDEADGEFEPWNGLLPDHDDGIPVLPPMEHSHQ